MLWSSTQEWSNSDNASEVISFLLIWEALEWLLACVWWAGGDDVGRSSLALAVQINMKNKNQDSS